MNTYTCTICGEQITGVMVGTIGGGMAHRHCYEKQNPPRVAISVFEMARGVGDPVLAAQVLHELVPAELARDILDEYHKRLAKSWLRRCEP